MPEPTEVSIAVEKAEERIMKKVEALIKEGKHVYEYMEVDAKTITFLDMYRLGRAGWKYCFNTYDIRLKSTTEPKFIFQRANEGTREETPKIEEEIKDLEDL